MGLTGIDKVVYGVEDIDESRRFFTDWGLSDAASHAGPGVLMTTLDGGEVALRDANDTALPEAIEAGSTVRRLVFGVADAPALAALEARLGDRLHDGEDGPEMRDPNGLAIAFRVSRRRRAEAYGAPVNTVDRTDRVDRRAPVYERAEPVRIGHAVFFAPDVTEVVDFYTRELGFIVSDSYPGDGYFLRCAEVGAHHDFFVLRTPDGKRGLNHVSFVVRDIHEVFGGGMAMDRLGWRTQMGPGRHPISSAYFWYVHCPAGAVTEYFADEDHCTANWPAREWERSAANYAEWAVAGGIDGNTRRLARKETGDG